MIGRKAGKYHDAEGNLATEDQSVTDWRKQLIAETRKDNNECSEKAAHELLFPIAGRKSRENKRQTTLHQYRGTPGVFELQEYKTPTSTHES
jgi:hypothetical protein